MFKICEKEEEKEYLATSQSVNKMELERKKYKWIFLKYQNL